MLRWFLELETPQMIGVVLLGLTGCAVAWYGIYVGAGYAWRGAATLLHLLAG